MESVLTEPCLLPEYVKIESESLFRKVWRYVARQEELPNPGHYLARGLSACNTSVFYVRCVDGTIRGFLTIRPSWHFSPSQDISGLFHLTNRATAGPPSIREKAVECSQSGATIPSFFCLPEMLIGSTSQRYVQIVIYHRQSGSTL